MAITEEQVFSAAEEIRESGRFPSAISIREITKTGSLGTIQKHLRKWRHRETVSASSNNPPPEEVLDALRNFGDSFWRLAIQHSDKAALQKVRLARDEQDEARRDMEEALDNLETQRAEAERLSKLIDDSTEKENQLKAELDLQKDVVHKASLQCHQLEDTLKSLDARYRELELVEKELRQKAEDLNVSLEKASLEKDQLQKLIHDQEKVNGDLKNKLQEMEGELQKAKNLSDVQKKETETLQTQLQEEKGRSNQVAAEKEILTKGIEEEKALNLDLQTQLREAQVKLESTLIINQRLEAIIEKLTPNPKP